MNAPEAIHWIRQTAFIALLGGELARQAVEEIGDALLAAPILTIQVDLAELQALDVITTLRRRYGPNMLVGAGGIKTVQKADQALAAGAQYLVGHGYSPGIAQSCRNKNNLYIPTISSQAEGLEALAGDCRLLALSTPNAPLLQSLRQALPAAEFIVAGGVTRENLAKLAQAGAAAVVLNEALFPSSVWTQAQIITAARHLTKTWNIAIKQFPQLLY